MSTRAAVVGGGTMGVGIAYVLCVAGASTTVVEPSASRRAAVLEEFQAALASGAARGKIAGPGATAALDRLTLVPDIGELATGLDVVIESIPERVDAKIEVLGQLESLRPAVLASNTSSISIDKLARALEHPDRFLGLHFFNPVWAIPLVEVVRGTATSDQTIAAALVLVASLGKEAAVVNDAPGFATSRLDIIVAIEAMRMLEEGVARAEDIDRAIRLAYRHPIGPLALSDFVGLDVRLDTARLLERSLGDRFAPPRILVELVEAGHLGVKTGRGFLSWD